MKPAPASIPTRSGPPLPAAWAGPRDAPACVALAHGAGAGMDHPFMRAVHEGLAAAGLLAVRFQFPYMAAGRRAPDRPPVLRAAWHDVLAAARERAPGRPLVAAGKSMGGRIASLVAAEGGDLDALLVLGYPLHPAGRPDRLRVDHFPEIRVPTLLVQGTRDALCDLELLRAHLPRIPAPTQLHVVDGGDHSFKVLKRSGREQAAVDAEVLSTCTDWVASLAEHSGA